MVLFLLLNSIGNYALHYYHVKHVKPFGVQRSIGILGYMLHGSSTSLKVFGDVWYISYWTYILWINTITSIKLETLGNKTFILFQLDLGNINALNELCVNRIRTLAINSEGVIYGTAWGFPVYLNNIKALEKTLSIYYNKIYSDRYFALFDLN